MAHFLRVSKILLAIFVRPGLYGLIVLGILLALYSSLPLVLAPTQSISARKSILLLAPIMVALVTIIAQVSVWFGQRVSLTIQENTAILLVFGVYAAAIFGTLRFLLEDSFPQSYAVEQPVLDDIKRKELVFATTLENDLRADIVFIKQAQDDLSKPCTAHVIKSTSEYFRYALQGPSATPVISWNGLGPGSNACHVLVLCRSMDTQEFDIAFRLSSGRDSAYEILIDAPSRFVPWSRDYKFFLRRGRRQVHIPSVEHDYGARYPRVMELTRHSFEDPRRPENITVLLEELRKLQIRQLNALMLRIAYLRTEHSRPRLDASRIILATIVSFVGSSGGVSPVSAQAQMLDLAFNALRILFVAVFFNSLARRQEQ